MNYEIAFFLSRAASIPHYCSYADDSRKGAEADAGLAQGDAVLVRAPVEHGLLRSGTVRLRHRARRHPSGPLVAYRTGDHRSSFPPVHGTTLRHYATRTYLC